MTKGKNTLLVAALLAGTAGAGSAYAQAAPASDQPATPSGAAAEPRPAVSDEDAGGIVVTAQRRAQRLVDVPVSVTAITGATLEKQAVTGIFDVTSSAPGVVINRNGGYLQPTIRGIGTNVTGSTADPNVAIYLDGVYQPSQTGNFFDLANISQVEVLKGPQGTLFGRNATGGAILVTTSDPSFTTSGRVTASYGRYNEARGSAFLTTGLTDKIAVNFSAYYRHTDGFKHDARTGALVTQQHSLDLRSKLLFQASEDVKFVLTLDYNDTSDPTGLAFNALGGNSAGRLLPNSGPIAEDRTLLSHNLLPVIQAKAKSATFHADFDLGFATLRSISAYRDEKVHIESDLDATYGVSSQAVYDQPLKTFSQEVTLTSRDTGAFTWVTGVFYYNAVGTYPGFVLNNVLALHAKDKVDAYAVFADGTYKLGDFSIFGGVRYSSERREHFYGPGASTNPYTVDVAKRFGDFTPRIGIRYAIDPHSNVYFSFSKGFKSGLFNNTSPSTLPVNPEKVDAYEVGYKTATRTFDLNLSSYYYKYKDIQVTAFDTTGGGISRLFNAAKAEIYGFDAEAVVRPTPDFDIRAAFAYTHARYTSFPGAITFVPKPGGNIGNNTVIVDASGSTMLRAPEVTLSGTANYRVQVGGHQVEFTVTPYFTSKINYTYDERVEQPAYVTVDASISYMVNDALRLSIWGKNLTDKTYGSFRSTSATRDSIVYAAPRTYGVSGSYKF